jgi:hypothetical protein
MNERIKAAKFFGLDKWPKIRISALKLALQETLPADPDKAKIARINKRFQTGRALAFYADNQNLFW